MYFVTVTGNVITLFLMMGVGFFLAKRGRLSGETLSQLSYLLLFVVAPCIVIEQFQIEASEEMIRSLIIATFALGSYYLLFLPLSQLLFRKQPQDTRVCLRFGSVYGNVGFMGLPLLLSVFGEEALIYGAVSLVAFAVAQWTHGVSIMGGGCSVKKVILNPGIIGIAIGLTFFITGFKLPVMLGSAVSFIGSINTPIAMVVIGGQMAGVDFITTFTKAKLYSVALVKLLIIPGVTALVLLPFNLPPLIYSVCVVLSAAPSGAVTSIFALQFGRDTDTAAQLVTLSTLLSVITLPLWVVAAEILR